jgi:hypothetical protein
MIEIPKSIFFFMEFVHWNLYVNWNLLPGIYLLFGFWSLDFHCPEIGINVYDSIRLPSAPLPSAPLRKLRKFLADRA